MNFNVETACLQAYGYYSGDFHLEPNYRSCTVKLKSNSKNYAVALSHLYPMLRWSIFDMAAFNGDRRITGHDVLLMRNALIDFFKGTQISKKDVEEALEVVAKATPFNPLREYFFNLPRVTTNHLNTWLTKICGAADTPINRVIGRKWLISAVARGMEPGSYVEGTLILFGKQAAGKTTFFTNINPKEEYYCGNNINISDERTAAQSYQGKFIVEFGELSQIRKADLENVKNFLTLTKDTYVPKYSNYSETHPRMMIFGGSTNSPDILHDTTGNRRFWAVEVGTINNQLLREIKKDLWAEAYAAYQSGEDWTLNDEERELLEASNEAFEADDPLSDYLEGVLRQMPDESFRISSVVTMAKSFEPRTHEKAVAKSLRRLGFTRKMSSKGESKGCYRWLPPAGFCSQERWN